MKKMTDYTEGILCAGFGGQGIIFMGKLIAEAAVAGKRHVTWMPSYGAEVRGGTAYSMVKISNKEIGSPIVTRPNILIVMNEPSLLKYEEKLTEDGILILNKSMISEKPRRKDVKVIGIPMTDIAAKLGNTRCANMIAVGAFAKLSRMITLRNTIEALKDMMKGKEDLHSLNKSALEKGHKF
jgi:2-oxoglutarate ferredoxin oxidoreductase subunit gamma